MSRILQVHRNFWPTATPATGQQLTAVPSRFLLPPKNCFKSNNLVFRAKPTVDVQRLVEFLYDDLSHLFDVQGIDQTAYDECIKFRDPITKYDTIHGYLFNISIMKVLFRPHFQLHWAKQTGPYEITTRWTVVMNYILLPWKPELVFTGTSIMDINPETGKFCTHQDFWDSIENNDYYSLECLWDIFKQFGNFSTPHLEMPKYQVLKRTPNYEVRKYIHDADFSKVSIELVLPPDEDDMSSMTDSDDEIDRLIKMESGGIAASLKFSGKPSVDFIIEKEKALRSSLIKDGLKPKNGCLLVRYNDQNLRWSFIMRNEVVIWLEEFSLDL